MHPGCRTILVIEDEPPIAETILYALKTEGYTPVWQATGRGGLEVLKAEPVALVVLDVGLPDMSGFEVCREIQRQRTLPIIFLTARSEEVDRIVGLELGADDYMAKPFSPRELTARIRAVLRRVKAEDVSATAPASARVWTHDEARCRIAYRGTPLELTRNEYRLLRTLIGQPGRVFSRDQLMTAAWDDPAAALDRTVDAHIKTVRAKLGAAVTGADPIVTHRGMGYSIREES